MRVFLCGAQGTGKSTLVNRLSSFLLLEKKDSLSNSFLKNNSLVQTSDNEGFNEFQDKILLFCLSEYVNNNNFIASRSIIDSYAYLSANKAKNEIPLKNLLTHYSDYLLKKDDLYVYLPIEFDISKEGNSNRNTGVDYQREVDKQIQKYFNKFKALKSEASFITLTGSIEERLEELTKKILSLRNV